MSQIDLPDDVVKMLAIDGRLDAEDIESFQCGVDAMLALLHARGGTWSEITAEQVARMLAVIAIVAEDPEADRKFDELMLQAARKRGFAVVVMSDGSTVEVKTETPAD